MSILKRLTGREKSETLLNDIKRKAHEGSETHQFMLDKFESFLVKNGPKGTKTFTDPQTGNEYNFEEAVKKARQAGILHYVNVRKRNQASDTYSKWTESDKEQHWKDALGHAVTRTQKGQEVEYYKAKKPKAKGSPLWAIGRAGNFMKREEKEVEIGNWGKEIDNLAKQEKNFLKRRKEKGKTPEITDDVLSNARDYLGAEEEIAEYEAKRKQNAEEEKKEEEKKIFCLACKQWYPRGAKKCPHCDTPNPSYKGKPDSLRETSGKRIKPRVYEVLIFILIGLFCLVGTPFFGLPSFPLLAVAFIVFIPAYIFLPGEHEVLSSIQEGEDIGSKGWALLPKSAMKLTAYILIIIQFFMFNRLIALAISFFFYFTLPTRYKTSQPFKAMEAWARMGFGVFLAILFYLTFSTPLSGVNNVGLSLGFLGAAFFITFPIQIAAEDDESKININFTKGYGDLTKGKTFFYIDRAFFSIFMIIGLITFGFGTGLMQLVFYAIWALSFFVGWSAGPEGRPAMGILTIMIALFVFSSTYTGVVGQAIFGYYWPQVQSFVETFGAPLSDMWQQAQSGMSDTFLMITNPQAYMLQQQQSSQVKRSALTSGGTTKSIEMSDFKLYGGSTGYLDPRYDSLVVSAELQNQGEFESNRISLDVWAAFKNPTTLEETKTGTINEISCSKPAVNPEGSKKDQVGNCDWSEGTIIYPSEMKVANFVYNMKWDKGIDLAECNNATGTDVLGNPIKCNDCTITAECSMPVYVHSGETVKISANYTYDYNVNVSMQVDVINAERYDNLRQSNQITLQEITSQYTGGPVKAAIVSQRQPIRNGEQSLFVASVYNDGNGVLSNVKKFEIRIPEELGIPSIVSQTFRSKSPQEQPEPKGCSLIGVVNGYYNITCENTYGVIEKGEFKRVSFFITPKYEDIIDIRTTLMVGFVNYEYKKTTSQSLTIVNAPPQ